jgi:hypothetical protein
VTDRRLALAADGTVIYRSDRRWPLNGRYHEQALVCNGVEHVTLVAVQETAHDHTGVSVVEREACDGWSCRGWIRVKGKGA